MVRYGFRHTESNSPAAEMLHPHHSQHLSCTPKLSHPAVLHCSLPLPGSCSSLLQLESFGAAAQLASTACSTHLFPVVQALEVVIPEVLALLGVLRLAHALQGATKAAIEVKRRPAQPAARAALQGRAASLPWHLAPLRGMPPVTTNSGAMTHPPRRSPSRWDSTCIQATSPGHSLLRESWCTTEPVMCSPARAPSDAEPAGHPSLSAGANTLGCRQIDMESPSPGLPPSVTLIPLLETLWVGGVQQALCDFRTSCKGYF